MKIKINDQTTNKMNIKPLYFETKNSIVYTKNKGKFQELSRQSIVQSKLKRLLIQYDDDNDVPLKEKERSVIKMLNKNANKTRKEKTSKRKTAKIFNFW